MKKINNNFFFYLIFFFLVPQVRGAILKIESDSYLSKYIDDTKQTRLPLFEQFSVAYNDEGNNSDYNFNFVYFYDFERKVYDFQLNHLNFSKKSMDGKTSFSIGRIYNTKYLIFSSVVDHLSTSYKFYNDQAEVGFYLGKSRNFELNNNQAEANLFGSFLYLTQEQVFPWRLGLKWEQTDYSFVNREKSDWAEINLKKEFPIFLNPEILISHQNNLRNTLSYRKAMAVTIYPSSDNLLGLRGLLYRRDKKDFWEESISSIIAKDEIKELGLNSGNNLNTHWYLGFDVSISEYELQENSKKIGSKIDSTLKWVGDAYLFELNAFKISSYGGWVHGEKSRFILPFAKRKELEISQEYVQYDKITNAKNSASQFQVGLATWFSSYSRFWLAGELVSNNFYSQDVRFLTQLSIYDWRDL
jgi:hypothetical protein